MKLVRQLSFIEVLALPVALMAPSAGMGLNTPFVAASAGAGVPFIFILSTLGIACVGAGFYRLSRRFNDAGSVYGLTKASIGPRFGFIAGWCLALVYVTFIGTLLAGFATFADLLIDSVTGVNPPWAVMFLLGGAGIWALGYRKIELSTQVFLVLEGISILLMFVLAVVIFVKGGAHGHGLTLKPLTPSGVASGGLGGALVFGFLTFIGFEGSAVLGEESKRPEVAIPLSLAAAVILAGLVFIVISYAQTVGFGVDKVGVAAYSSSAAPNTDLAGTYLGNWAAQATNLGAALSTFACALASADGAARVVFSLARDGRLSERLSAVHPTHLSPHKALNVSMVLGLIGGLAFFPFTDKPSDVYGWMGALATLAVIIAYGMTSVAATIFFFRADLARHRYLNFVPPVLALPLLVYTFKAQLLPLPPAPLRYWPYAIAAFLLVGVGILYAQRGRSTPTEVAYDAASAEAV